MSPFIKLILVMISVLFVSCSNATDDRAFINKMNNRLSEASLWLVENGIEYLESNCNGELRSLLIDRWAVQMWVDPTIDSDRFYASFRLKARGIYYDIICLHRLHEDRIYEYWIIKKSAEPTVDFQNGCVFLAAVADSVKGRRSILETSETFVTGFAIDGNVNLELPVNDNRLLYDLAAWKFPLCYPSSALKDIQIEIVDGDYVKVRESP